MLGKGKQYSGVGGHLFAVMIEASVKAGYILWTMFESSVILNVRIGCS